MYLYIVLVTLGILACSALSVYILSEFLKTFGTASDYEIPLNQAPAPEVVAAITASLTAMMGSPNYNFIIKKGGTYNA